MEPRERADALISLLGFPGWGPLHLHLCQDGTPASLARLLQPGLRGRAGSLPTLLLRSCPTAEPLPPLGAAWPIGGCRLRYRLIWRPGAAADARITLWRRPAGCQAWSCAWPTTRLQGFTAHWCQEERGSSTDRSAASAAPSFPAACFPAESSGSGAPAATAAAAAAAPAEATPEPAWMPAWPPARTPARTPSSDAPVSGRDARGLGLMPCSDWRP